jgi:toxin ParE1/3/4
MSIYSLTDEAIQDLDDISTYMSDFSLDTATNFLDSFERKCEALTQFPQMGKIYEDLSPYLRGVPIDGYIIFYRVVENNIEVIRVISGRRNLKKVLSNI